METDRISVLPDEVLVNILSCLPTRYAIQTSVLSNRWRYLWTFKPNLEFLVEPHNATTTLQEQQVDIINHCLDNYKSNTLQTLDILLLLKGEFTLDVERWIRFAARRGVVELHMRCGVSKVLINLPRELFSCKSLSSLVLWNSLFDPPLDFNGFSNLKLLEIVSAFITDKTLHNLLVTCPLLEDLTLRCCPGLKILNISSSILKKLVIYDCFFLEKLVIDAPNISAFEYEGLLLEFRLINVPHLLEIDLQIKDAKKFLVVQDWRLVISKIAHVKFLTVGSWFTEFIFAEYYVNNRPRTSFINLKEFRWSGHLLSRKVILAIVTFLENCPLLEKVYIDLDQNSSIANYWNRHHNLFVEKWIPHSQYAFSVNGNEDSPQPKKQKQYLRHFEYSFHHLKTIEMVGFSGKKKEMDLVKFLLNKSVVLDMFVLTSSTENVNRLPNRILQERLSRLPKASLCADVVLFEPLPADFLEEYTASA